MKVYSKESLIKSIREICDNGWYESVKVTRDTRNDGAVGNTLEVLLGIPENNLPIPNATEWELKGQRSQTGSLITLKHIEPSPKGAKIVSDLLLPQYGWRHKLAGISYPEDEMSFRSTTSTSFTKRGFAIIVDRISGKIRFVFDAAKADKSDPDIRVWLEGVRERVGLGKLDPEPYWGFDDLMYEIGAKIKNCFYVVADAKVVDGREYFKYVKLFMLSKFSFEKFLKCMENGNVLIDFDARTRHNHGTKFRLRQGCWSELYSRVDELV